MKKIWRYLLNHIREDFDTRHYLFISIFLGICIFINYQIGFEEKFLNRQTDLTRLLYYFIFYSAAYYFSLCFYAFFSKQNDFFRRKDFWIKSLLILFVISLDSSIPFLRSLIEQLFNPKLQYWVYKVGLNLLRFSSIILPLIFYFIYERKEKHIYGLQTKSFEALPYFIIFLLTVPLIVSASFKPDFLNQYPMYKSSQAHSFLNMPEWTMISGYEMAYGLNFISVEFIFRGFMVIGMMSLLGRGAVLSMVVTYCLLHFGKPAGEAISSIFGGYILGAIAYETKSIWGGVIVHIGIAWTMELMAFLQKSV